LNWIKRHFERYRQMPPWEFCWKLVIEGLLVSFLVLIPIALLSKVEERAVLKKPAVELLIFAALLVPPVETVIFQALPIAIARRLKAGFAGELAAATALFAAAHFYESFAVGVVAGLVGGFYLAFSYAHWIRQSAWTAFWVTTVHHAIRNFVIIAPLVIAQLLGATG
jgi:hypothetical protein